MCQCRTARGALLKRAQQRINGGVWSVACAGAAWVHPRSSWSAGLNSCLLPVFALQGKLLGFGNTLLPLARLSQAVSTTFGSEKRSSSLPNNKVGMVLTSGKPHSRCICAT